MSTIQERIYESLKLKYESEIAEAQFKLDLYYNNPVGVGEHPQIIDEIDNAIKSLGESKDKLQTLKESKKIWR
jgi:predicted transcriptional regulator